MPNSYRLLAFLLIAVVALPVGAQDHISPNDDWCENDHWTRNDDGDFARACEVRTFTLAVRDQFTVDAGNYGGVSVEAWDRDAVQLRARINVNTRVESEARRLVDAITIETDGTITSRVPRTGNDTWATVSFRLMVPRQTDLDLTAENGGISVEGVDGRIRFQTVNGGVSLVDLAGDVEGRTVNGGLSVTLNGSGWNGEGLDVETTNGGLSLTIPPNYSADLETGTINGSLRLDFPVTVQGDLRRHLRTTLGRGGRLIRAVTTNGGAIIERG
ncbi:MAG: hypothetical protein HKN04_15275 [Rhodothermaceae bacterium]|nr:hypothetical protein [Rhodothermaceae bacterium]